MYLDEQRLWISSHAENSTSNQTGEQNKTLYREWVYKKVMSTHSERWDFLYLQSTDHSLDIVALMSSHVSRTLNTEKHISRVAEISDLDVDLVCLCNWDIYQKIESWYTSWRWAGQRETRQAGCLHRAERDTAESGRVKAKARWLTHQQGSTDRHKTGHIWAQLCPRTQHAARLQGQRTHLNRRLGQSSTKLIPGFHLF